MTTPQFMHGPERVRSILGAYLASTMPVMLVKCRAEWLREIWELPDPTAYDLYEPYVVDGYPVVGCYITGDQSMSRKDYDGNMAEEYEVVYTVRVFVGVRTPMDDQGKFTDPPYAAAVRCRDEMTTVLRMCLLQQPSMGYPEEAEIQEDTINTDYPDAMQLKTQGARFVATGIINVQIKLTEKLTRAPLGTANTVVVHPALMEE